MFVDFDDIFNENPKSQFNIPPKYIELLNKRLPKGIKYILDKEGNCIISSDEEEIRIGGIKAVLNEEQKKILGKNYKLNDVLDYAYNSQQKIEVQPIEEGYIKLNDNKFPIDKLEYNPLNPFKIIEEKFYIFPPKFEEKIELKLSDGKYERVVFVTRVPNKSIDILSFESKKDEPLQINYTINQSSNKFKMNISFNLNYAKQIRDIVESVYIYNAFVEKKGYIGDKLLDFIIDENQYKKYDEKSARFWEKVLMLEKKLDIKFQPPKENLEYSKILEIEELYQSIILKRPYRDKNVVNSINAEWNFNNDINEYKGKSVFFQFNATYSNEILGQKINLPALLMIFNSKLARLEKNKKNTEIILEDKCEDKKRYTSIMCFEDDKQLEKYKKQLNSMIIQMFKEAKTAYQYLEDNEKK